LDNWVHLDPESHGLTALQILTAITQNDLYTIPTEQRESLKAAILEICPGKGDDFPSAKSLGRRLISLRGRVAGSRKLMGIPDRNKINLWHVRPVV